MSQELYQRADRAIKENYALRQEHQLVAEQARLHARKLLFTQTLLHSHLSETLVDLYRRLSD